MRFKMVAVVAAAGVVAASCSGASESATSVPSSDSPSPVSVLEQSRDETPPSTEMAEPRATDPQVIEPSSTESSTSSEVDEPSTITVETDFGSFELPSNPERIVVVDPVVALPTALDLGAPVVATITGIGEGRAPSTLLTDAEWDNLESVGVAAIVNFEAVALQRPDLILATPASPEEMELYQQIAPSLPVLYISDWRDNARLVGASLGKQDVVDQQIEEYEQRAADLAERIDSALGDPTIALVRFRPDSIRVHTSAHFAGSIIADAGLRMPEEWIREPFPDDPLANLNINHRIAKISPELLGDLATADHLLVLVHGSPQQTADEVASAFAAIESGLLWQSLPAVQNGQVHFVGAHWMLGSGRAANLALSDLEGFLL